MTGLLIFLLGIIAFGTAMVFSLRMVANQRRRDAKLADRLATLRPTDAAAASSNALLGPDAGPRFLRVQMARADIQIEARTVYFAGLTVLALGAVLAWMGRPVTALVMVAVAASAAAILVRWLARRHTAGLIRELPFLLDGVRQHLTVGASLQQAMTRGVDTAGPDIKRAFLPMSRRIQNGATMVEGLAWLAERLELPEIDMLLMAIQTNTRFGGGMSPTLQHFSQILRERARVGRDLRAATAENRLSGWVLAGLPVLAIVAITVLNPTYASFLTDTETGHRMLAAAVGFQLVGCVCMSRIMELDF